MAIDEAPRVQRRPRSPARAGARDAFAGSRAYGALTTGAELLSLAATVLRLAVRPPVKWLNPAIDEASLAFRRCLVPTAVSVGVWTLGFGTLLFGRFVANLGIADRFPGGTHIGYIREVNTWITLMVFAGVAGSAAAADLGARRIREELDALDVLAVDKLRSLVVPRVIGMTLAAAVLPLLALLTTTFLNFLIAPAFLGFSDGVFFEGLKRNIIGIDIYASVLKHALMGFFVAIVACQKGLSCNKGAEGVGRAVNETVVLSFLGIWLLNTFFNLAYLSFFPEASALRG